ncbi:MAG: type II secretion system protein [Nitrospinae bacterium]|nr:type II secretion system protein [Nitrospinota bacterium]
MSRGTLFCKDGKESGFTLIELVMVIVILGILAAIAIPKYMDLSANAKKSEVAGFAGALAGAGAANFAGCKVNNNVAGANCVLITTCATTNQILQGAAFPEDSTGAAITVSNVSGTEASGGTAVCKVNGADSTAAQAAFAGWTGYQFAITFP